MTFFGKTIDSIIADITSKIDALHVVAEAHAAEALVQVQLEAAASKARVFAENEFARAKALAAKFEALVKV